MCAPAEFRGLTSFADESIHRPGIHEFAGTLWHVRDLRVTFGNMHDLDAELVGESSPILTSARIASVNSRVRSNVQHRLLDQVRHQTRIGAMREDSGGRGLTRP